MSYTQKIVLGYITLAIIGGCVLALPISSAQGTSTSLFDSFFTSVSAVCITGLAVFDTALHWSPFGQIVIMLLFQIGGLGFISLWVLVAVFRGKKIGLGSRSMLKHSIGLLQLSGAVRLLKLIVTVTFWTEFIGAIVLSFIFIPEYGITDGIFYSIFHSISAFCNAGFNLVDLMDYRADLVVNIVLMSLIIIGGIGFVVWDDVIKYKLKWKEYSFHSRLVLVVTFLILLFGSVLFWLFERTPVLQTVFMTVARTAGISTMDLSLLNDNGELLLTALMFIGGSPGSTAGGIKITTFVIVLASMFSNIRRKQHTEVMGRRISVDTVRAATTLFTFYVLTTVTATGVLCAVDELSLETALFEIVSAFGTVGLSLGITSELSALSQTVLIVLMFAGRVGLFSIVAATYEKRITPDIEKPIANVLI
ncbi:MAG: Trk family potassium uptake protein [Ruminococcus sp.]|jgi:trk system potassium uptake protein TrkH|nr:Trk family potassium uptake protein [Ruminococcus sp.]